MKEVSYHISANEKKPLPLCLAAAIKQLAQQRTFTTPSPNKTITKQEKDIMEKDYDIAE